MEKFTNVVPLEPKRAGRPREAHENDGEVVEFKGMKESRDTQTAVAEMETSIQEWRSEIERRLAVENAGGSLARAKFGATMLADIDIFTQYVTELKKEIAAKDPDVDMHFARIFSLWGTLEKDLSENSALLGRLRA